MKPFHAALIASVLFLAGCALVPAPYSDKLDPVGTAYASVRTGTPREQIEAQFGAPARTEPDGAVAWEARCDDLNYNVLKVWFDSRGKAEKIETTRAHGKSTETFRTSAVWTREKHADVAGR